SSNVIKNLFSNPDCESKTRLRAGNKGIPNDEARITKTERKPKSQIQTHSSFVFQPGGTSRFDHPLEPSTWARGCAVGFMPASSIQCPAAPTPGPARDNQGCSADRGFRAATTRRSRPVRRP